MKLQFINFKHSAPQKGGFLLELMIGMMISIVVVVAIMTLYEKFEGDKRNTTQISQSLNAGALSLFPIERQASMAGYAFGNFPFLGCTTHVYNEISQTAQTFTLTPLLINKASDNTDSDSFTLFSSNASAAFSPVSLITTMSSATSSFTVDSSFGLLPGNIFLIGQAGQDCSIAQISSISNNIISHNSGNYQNISGENLTTQFNDSNGLNQAYQIGAKVINLGSTPQMMKYSIENNQLIQENLLSNTNTKTVLANQVVLLKAQYALDIQGDGNMDTWSDTTPDSSQIQSIVGIRFAYLVRSAIKEKTCNVTTNSEFNWQGGVMDVANIQDWGCYRYKLFQTVIPFRNMLWSGK